METSLIYSLRFLLWAGYRAEKEIDCLDIYLVFFQNNVFIRHSVALLHANIHDVAIDIVIAKTCLELWGLRNCACSLLSFQVVHVHVTLKHIASLKCKSLNTVSFVITSLTNAQCSWTILFLKRLI